MPDLTTKDAQLEKIVELTDTLSTDIPEKFNEYLPLTGGTMTGRITREMEKPGDEFGFTVQYTDYINGTNPGAALGGLDFISKDKNGDYLAGLRTYIWNGGGVSARVLSRWDGTTKMVELISDTNNFGFRALSDNDVKLGGASYRWKEVFAGTGTINTSDERLKENITAISDGVLDAWAEVEWCQYRFKDAVSEKGKNARYHIGSIAQRIQKIFESHGLDAFKYGLLCYDKWNAQDEERDENGNVVVEAHPAGDRYSLRYEEALCLEAAYQRRRADQLEKRIEALEAKSTRKKK